MINPESIAEKDSIECLTFPIGDLQSNCTIVLSRSSGEAVIFDPGDDSKSLLEYIEKESLKVLKLIHTHGHFDHVAGSNTIKEKTGAPMALHRDDIPLYDSLEQQGKMFALSLPRPGTIDEAFNEGDSFNIPESALSNWISTLKILHTPGHSPGGCCFYSDYFDPPILIAGDTLFHQSIGRTDLLGGNYADLVNAIKNKLFILPPETIVIAGHGPTTKIGHEKKFNPFLNKMI